VEFKPDPGQAMVSYVSPDTIKAISRNSAAEAATVAIEGQAQGTANPVTGGIDVTQTVTARTFLPSSDQSAGNSAKHFQQELKRIDKFRQGTDRADFAARALARKGFPDVISAKQAVEQSTHNIIMETAREGKREFDLFNSNN
jgi:hypothetical protein